MNAQSTNQENIRSLLESSLQKLRNEIVRQWTQKLSIASEFLLFRMSRDVKGALDGYFEEITSFLNRGPLQIPRLPPKPFPMDTTKNELCVFLVGEEVFTEILRDYVRASDKEWLPLRRELNQVFHEAIRSNAATACDSCRWDANEKLATLDRLKGDIKEAKARSYPKPKIFNQDTRTP